MEKRIQLEDLLHIKNNKTHTIDVFVESLNGSVQVQRIDSKKVLQIMDEMSRLGENASMSAVIDTYKLLIYDSVPMLKNKELQDSYDNLVEPYDIVLEIFEIGEIMEIANKILSELYGFTDLYDEIKN